MDEQHNMTADEAALEVKRLTERLIEYREELTRYYMATAKMMDKEKIIEGVDHLVNPLDNAINEISK